MSCSDEWVLWLAKPIPPKASTTKKLMITDNGIPDVVAIDPVGFHDYCPVFASWPHQ